jgi:hypothetical protein
MSPEHDSQKLRTQTYFNLMILDNKRERKKWQNKWQQALPEFSLLLISCNKFWFVVLVAKHLKFSIFSQDFF